MNTWDAFYGPNAGYALELYERYLEDRNSVDAETRAFFDQLGSDGLGRQGSTAAESTTSGGQTATAVEERQGRPVTAASGNGARAPAAPAAPPLTAPETTAPESIWRIVAAARLARSIREYGHLAADIDPLGAPRPGDPMLDPGTHGITEADLASLPGTIVFPGSSPEAGTCLDGINRLKEIYCGPIGYEFDHVEDFEERTWLHQAVESGVYRAPLLPEQKRALLKRLTEVEGFERYLHTVFVGQKRFSIEGTDALVPMLDDLIDEAAETGTREVLIGMAHRGRLNVLAHILGKPYAAIFSEFHSAARKEEPQAQGAAVVSRGWTGDVKYHLGGQRKVREAEMVEVQITVADNPSHLEFVDPVVEGFTRAAQDCRQEAGTPRQDLSRALAVTIHGDAAFPGEGVVAETLNLSRLPGYETGGTMRIIVNNQIGFTTGPEAGRSTLYASDLAKGFEIPIVHVNADQPEAALAVIKLACAYRARFHKDFLIDLVGYRRWGHNEGDEPSFTQPRLYAQISSHLTARALYARQLEAEHVVSAQEAEAMQREEQERLQQARDEPANTPDVKQPWVAPIDVGRIETAVPADLLRAYHDALQRFPEGFSPNPKLERVLRRRQEALERPGGIDWGLAEALAFASILADGTPIRLTGQDTERGTFSQRHTVLHDPASGATYIPLQTLPQARASFAVYNSPLTEAAVIGFEYGYSVHAPEALVLWEAQFGDFANAGQVLIDQFIAAARAKWRQQPAQVLLLPHGYEGQGPEHSSARLERFLQLAAEDNLRIANCTTAAQYFHLLRMQAATLDSDRRPLIDLTPKSLLRHPRAASSLADLSEGRFQSVLDDPDAADRREKVERLILCSGKIAVDLATTVTMRERPVDWVAVARVELLYPFPAQELEEVISRYPNLRGVVWLQEEPRNMGAWTYVAPRISELLPQSVRLRYIGRPERASTAEGSPEAHADEQARIVGVAFGSERPVSIETHGVEDVS